MRRPMSTYWVTGLPGSGKTTVTTHFWRARKEDLKEQIQIFNGIKIRFYLGERVALAGVYDEEDVLRNGTDRYGLTQRNALKYLWPYLSQKMKSIDTIVIEGLSVVNRPLLDTIKEWSTFHLLELNVPLETCKAQHADREAHLRKRRSDRVDPRFWYTKDRVDGVAAKIALKKERAHEVHFVTPDEALAYLNRMSPCERSVDEGIHKEVDGTQQKRQCTF